MGATLQLPGRTDPLTVTRPPWASSHKPPSSRRAYAAAHVAATGSGTIDWEATLAFRDHLWAHGFGVAEAMDTAQRGMGLSWDQAQELILRSSARARETGGLIACGAGTDQLADDHDTDLATVTRAYEEQIQLVESTGSTVIVMASRALARTARSPAEYSDVYGHLLAGVVRPVILHWLGDMFDPALAGYWGSADFDTAAATVLDIIQSAGGAVDGIKLSVLDAGKEIALRRRLPAGVRMYTGDDFNYSELIEGDYYGHSDALLGVLAAITVPAAEALAALDAGDVDRYRAIMEPTVPLGRKLFEAPTPLYKAGVAFLAWLNGLQPDFVMLDRLDERRTVSHLVEVFGLAAEAGALAEPELAIERMSFYLASRGQK
jgi:Protein of unknown function (DUF993)